MFVRSLCWVLGFCALCLLLFFRLDAARADGANATSQRLAWSFAGQVSVDKGRVQVAISWSFVSEPAPPKPDTPLPRTYAEARERALRTGLPLVVWVGEALCPGCVQRTKEEYVHWVTASFPDTPKDALVVAVVERGDLVRIGTMTQWPEGHLTTVAKALDLWRTHKQTTDQRSTPYRGVQATQTYFQATYSRKSSYVPAFRSRGRSGGC